MFGSNPNGAKLYAKVGIETGVGAASPHKLIAMLFEGALISINNAIEAMKKGDIPKKGAATSKAIMIIESGLRASLNKNVGGEIALNLDALYEYMAALLVSANLHNDLARYEEALSLLRELMGAWDAIGENAKGQPQAQLQVVDAAAPPPAYDALAPRPTNFVSA